MNEGDQALRPRIKICISGWQQHLSDKKRKGRRINKHDSNYSFHFERSTAGTCPQGTNPFLGNIKASAGTSLIASPLSQRMREREAFLISGS
jgi:hypothetical protein